jgi:3-hydroxyacyl-[acyl-carrier-protein] dehydratase
MNNQKTILDIEQIKEILPHRYPFIFIDRVIEFQPSKKLVAIKNISANEQFFVGHFPGEPVVPGVLIIESMAQAGIIFFAKSKRKDKEKLIYYLGKVEAKFISSVYPADQLRLEIRPVKLLSTTGVIDAKAYVSERLVAEAEIYFVVKPHPDKENNQGK